MSDLHDTNEMRATQPLPSPDRPTQNPLDRPPDRAAGYDPYSEAGYGTQPPKRKRARDRRNHPLYLPAWSVGLMLLLVIGIAGGVVALLVTLGGGLAPAGEPRFIIVTAAPDSELIPPPAADTQPDLEAVPPAFITAPPPDTDAGAFSIPLPTFALEGPTLPPVILTPTPIVIAVGSTVIVTGTDLLNIRRAAGLDATVIDQAAQNEQFTVIGGPEQASSITWWQIQDQVNPSRSGWVAADYLVVAGSGS